jgi:hypothetical protein
MTLTSLCYIDQHCCMPDVNLHACFTELLFSTSSSCAAMRLEWEGACAVFVLAV